MSTVEPIRDVKKIKEIEKILLSQNFRNYVLFKFGINCGLRISDILALNIEDVKNKDVILLTEIKTKKNRKIPINTELKNMLNKYTKNKAEKAPLFKSLNSNKRLDRINAYRIINKACKLAIIEGNTGTHTLRKTFGYHFYKKFKDIVLLQRIFNHSSPAITLRYIGITEDEIFERYACFTL